MYIDIMSRPGRPGGDTPTLPSSAAALPSLARAAGQSPRGRRRRRGVSSQLLASPWRRVLAELGGSPAPRVLAAPRVPSLWCSGVRATRCGGAPLRLVADVLVGLVLAAARSLGPDGPGAPSSVRWHEVSSGQPRGGALGARRRWLQAAARDRGGAELRAALLCLCRHGARRGLGWRCVRRPWRLWCLR